jgi:hypothetical protein
MRIFTFLFLLTAFAACEQEVKPPAGMLTEAELVELLVAFHMAEARADVMLIPRDSIRPLLDARYQEILEQMEIDSARFNASFAFYEQNPIQMDSLYQKVVDELVEREATYRSTTPDSVEPEVTDSILLPKP